MIAKLSGVGPGESPPVVHRDGQREHREQASEDIGRGTVSFSLDDLAQFHAVPLPPTASAEYRTFYVGWDDVHGVLKYLHQLPGTTRYTMNMFGFDDAELNDLVMKLVRDPMCLATITLDRSQAGGVHEKRLLDGDKHLDPVAFAAHIAIGQSATHSISHTKGGVIRSSGGAVAWEGSTNWSTDGEGTFVLGRDAAGGPGYKAQNNTLVVHLNPHEVEKFETRLLAEHAAAKAQQDARNAA
jgi:hypothetical protein